MTYTLLRSDKSDENTAPRIKSDYKLQHADVVADLRAAQRRKQRKVKRAVAAVAGWAIMGAMIYLIMVTQRTVIKIWNPYDILGISEVRIHGATVPWTRVG